MTAETENNAPSQDIVANMVSKIRSHINQEISSGFTPILAADIPVSVDNLTPEWLTAILCRDHPEARVLSHKIIGGSDGSTSRRTIRLKYNDHGDTAGLPVKIFGKAIPTLQNRLVCGLSGAIFSESDFYNIIRPHLDIEAPVSYFAIGDPNSFRSIMLLKDMTNTGTIFTDPTYYINRVKAEDMVSLLAAFHAKLWRNPLLDQLVKLKTSLKFQQDINDAIDFESRSNIGIDRAASIIPQSIKSNKDGMWTLGLMKSLEINITLPPTLVHNDVHIGNWYVTDKGRMGLTDWQCMVHGHGIADLSYTLSSALTIEDRRKWERDLVILYMEKLKENSITENTSFDEMWLCYRQQIFHAFYNWVYTIGAGEMQPDMQPENFCMLNIERMAAALEDLDSFLAVNPNT